MPQRVELQVKIKHLQNEIAEHERVLNHMQLKWAELESPPTIPLGASGAEIAAIFESRSDFDDRVLGLSAAVNELNRRRNILLAELGNCTTELRRIRELEADNELTHQILSEINS